MQPVLSVRDVADLEASVAEKGVDASELMRRAGTVVALQAMREVDEGSVVVLCGMGNNGGDGWVAADYLASHGHEVNVVTPAVASLIRSAPARAAAQRAASVGIPVHVAPDYDELVALLLEADVVVDAVFGTGFKGAMGAPFDMWVQAVDDYFEGTLVSVDVPSGIDATTGVAEGPYFQADSTVTMFALKPGLIAGLGKQAAGQLVVAALVADEEGAEELADAARSYRLGEADYLDALPVRDEFADKYGHGRVLVVAGSARFPGAAVMAAKAAARAGAGYVTLAVPAPVAPVAQAHLLSIPVVGLPAAKDGTFEAGACEHVEALAAKADCVLAGPGMGTSFGAGEVVRALLAGPAPLVLDADALNVAVKICSGSADEHPDPLRREAPLVLTPHARELARLMGAEPGSIGCLAQLIDASQSLAWSVGSANFAVVAKGATSCVSCIDATLVPKAGPSALGTAGTGDVLAGIAAGLVAQQVCDLGVEEVGSADLALLLSAALRIQARAAEAAVKRLGTRGVMASDLLDLIGVAFDDVQAHAFLAADAQGGGAGADAQADDEPVMALAPELEEAITAQAAVRAPEVPGEVHAYEGDLDEPEPAQLEDDGQDAQDAGGWVSDEAEDGFEDTGDGASERVACDADACEKRPEPAEPGPSQAACAQAGQTGVMGEIPADAVVRPAVRVGARSQAARETPAQPAKAVPAFLAALEADSVVAHEGQAVEAAPQAVGEPAGVEDALPERAHEVAERAGEALGGVPSFLAKAGKAVAASLGAVASCAPRKSHATQADAPAPVRPEPAEAPARPEPQAAAATAVPAFLSQHAPAAPVPPSACATTVMPALTLEDIARAQAAQARPAPMPTPAAGPEPQEEPALRESPAAPVVEAPANEHLSPDVKARQESRARLEDFHERATMRAGDAEVTPVQERPRARRVRRKK